MQYEYTVVDHGGAGICEIHVDTMMNNMAAKGWRLVAAVQRSGSASIWIRHYFEREKSLDK